MLGLFGRDGGACQLYMYQGVGLSGRDGGACQLYMYQGVGLSGRDRGVCQAYMHHGECLRGACQSHQGSIKWCVAVSRPLRTSAVRSASRSATGRTNVAANAST